MEDKECCTRPFGVKKTGQNFMRSMANIVKSGGKHVTEEVRQERIRLCESCEHFQGKTRQCGICRCIAHHLDILRTVKHTSSSLLRRVRFSSTARGRRLCLYSVPSWATPGLLVLVGERYDDRPCFWCHHGAHHCAPPAGDARAGMSDRAARYHSCAFSK